MKKIYFPILFIISICFSTNIEAQHVTLGTKTWPTPRVCHNCLSFQIAHISFKLPSEDTELINVLNLKKPAVELRFKPGNDRKIEEIMLLAISERNATGSLNANGYYERLEVENIKEFFDKIGTFSEDDKYLNVARKVMGVDEATGYIRFSKKNINAYWVKSKDIKNQNLYVMVDGDELIYLVAGKLNLEIINFLLANLEVVQ